MWKPIKISETPRNAQTNPEAIKRRSENGNEIYDEFVDAAEENVVVVVFVSAAFVAFDALIPKAISGFLNQLVPSTECD